MTTVCREFELIVKGREFRVQDVELAARDGDLTVIEIPIEGVREFSPDSDEWETPALSADEVREIHDAIVADLELDDLELDDLWEIEREIDEAEASWAAEAAGDAMRTEGY